MELREYQQSTVDQLWEWMGANEGHPVINLPTGSGKSLVIAELCRYAITEWPETKILMLTRSKELIEQNAEKLVEMWPNAPVGVYSASAGKKQLGESITIAGPLSIVNALEDIGFIDMVLIDECHDISHHPKGTYRKIIESVTEVNPALRVIGLTATPYRLGHGYITDKPAIFDAPMIEPVSITELVALEFLCPLRNKLTSHQISTDGVHKRGGEFIESELQAAVNTDENNAAIIAEALKQGEDRKAWMFFCTGVDHAKTLRDMLNDEGITAECVTGDMPKAARERAVNDFKAGRIRAMTNVNCLSTGFDHPGIDMLVLARPTMSPGLYMQQVGRGMRISPDKKDCKILDFAGVVSTHGPVTNVRPPSRKTKKIEGDAPVKPCPKCHELVHISVMTCPDCGHIFPPVEKEQVQLHYDTDIMGGQVVMEMGVRAWVWQVHESKLSKKEMIKITYYGVNLSDVPLDDYLTVAHGGYVGSKALARLGILALRTGLALSQDMELNDICKLFNNASGPAVVKYIKDGRYMRVTQYDWPDATP